MFLSNKYGVYSIFWNRAIWPQGTWKAKDKKNWEELLSEKSYFKEKKNKLKHCLYEVLAIKTRLKLSGTYWIWTTTVIFLFKKIFKKV